MFACGRFVRLFNARHCPTLPAFQFRAEAFGLRPQRLAAHLDASQLGQQSSCFSKRGDRTQRRLPAHQTRARLLIRRQAQRLVRRAPAMPTLPTVMPPPLHADRSESRLQLTLAVRLHASPLITSWAPRRERSRALLQSRRGQLQHTFEQCRRHPAPGCQHFIFVLGQAGIPMCLRVGREGSAEL